MRVLWGLDRYGGYCRRLHGLKCQAIGKILRAVFYYSGDQRCCEEMRQRRNTGNTGHWAAEPGKDAARI